MPALRKTGWWICKQQPSSRINKGSRFFAGTPLIYTRPLTGSINLKWFFQIIFLLVSIIQHLLFIIQIDLTALYKRICYCAALHVEDVTIADNDVGVLTHFYASRFIRHAHHLCCIQCNSLQGLFFCKSVGCGRTRAEWKVTPTGLVVLIRDGYQFTGFL